STCSASPIHDDKGNIIAVLDLTGPYDKVNHHTLGMVMSAAFSIETILVLKKLYKELQTSHALKSAIVESVSEGMIAVNAEQEITLINPRACKLLNMNNNCMGKKINEVLLKNNDSFLNRLKSSTQLYGETLNIKTSKGEKKFITNFNPILINNTANGEVVTFNEVNQVINRIVGARSNITFDDLIGISPIFQEAVSQAKIAAENNSNVLLLGESGVGKDLFAQAIHNASMRQNEPFLAINCAAIPRELIASELFGYSEGAFTGAKKGGKPGVFELADQGTVFLDEIGEMPADLQASLLRVLEEKSVFRLGGNEFIPVNVRLISATNKNLPEEIKNGNFRQDIFYRLSVMSIHLPPLRERIEDIPLLAEYLAQNIAKRFGKVINKIDPEVIEKLIQYQWPGNIRELSNFMERAVNFTKNGVITLDLFPKSIFITNKSTEPEYENRNYYLVAQSDVTKDVMESELIRSYMIKYSKNKSLVAKAMNISRSSLYRKIVKYGL
ncbi:MAG: sigma 54-interacting transcriptional regulator, partial [Syntrophomonadaceae bacterium]|nr:sigma 54-interacting transcriptional regulator [Syntrophomonadaceae bacterium]